MMRNLWLVLLMIGMAACQSSQKKEKSGCLKGVPLPEVDIYADYPMKQLDISQMAEVVYLPLGKKSEVKNHPYHSTFRGGMSENYIVSYNFDGEVEVFDYSGQSLYHFNYLHKEEGYLGINALVMDEKNEEIWILDYDHTFKVYTLEGTYRRKLELPESLNAKVVRNWSADTLLCYDDHRVADGLSKNPYPFYLFSKKDGGIRKLTSISVPYRINNDERFVLDLGGMRQTINFTLTTLPLTVGAGRAVLADYAKDTVFCMHQGEVSPLFIRKPSVFASLPFVLCSVDFVTSRYLFFCFSEKKQGENRFDRSLLMDLSTGEVFGYQLQNRNFEPWLSLSVQSWKSDYPSGWLVNEMTVDRFLQYHREGKLKGKAVEVAEKIKKTDTVVLILYKFFQSHN